MLAAMSASSPATDVHVRSHRGRKLLSFAAVAVLDVVAGTAVCMTADSLALVVLGAALILGSVPLGITIAAAARRDLSAVARGDVDAGGRASTRIALAGGAAAAALSAAAAVYLTWLLVQLGKLA
jgi:hypothetical protein